MTEPNAMVLTNVSEVVGALMNLASSARRLEECVDNLNAMPEVIGARGFVESLRSLRGYLQRTEEKGIHHTIVLRETLRLYRDRCAKGDA